MALGDLRHPLSLTAEPGGKLRPEPSQCHGPPSFPIFPLGPRPCQPCRSRVKAGWLVTAAPLTRARVAPCPPKSCPQETPGTPGTQGWRKKPRLRVEVPSGHGLLPELLLVPWARAVRPARERPTQSLCVFKGSEPSPHRGLRDEPGALAGGNSPWPTSTAQAAAAPRPARAPPLHPRPAVAPLQCPLLPHKSPGCLDL